MPKLVLSNGDVAPGTWCHRTRDFYLCFPEAPWLLCQLFCQSVRGASCQPVKATSREHSAAGGEWLWSLGPRRAIHYAANPETLCCGQFWRFKLDQQQGVCHRVDGVLQFWKQCPLNVATLVL